MKEAAHRHFDAARSLDGSSKRAAAAYLFGLAAECAVKAVLETTGLRPRFSERKTDPYYAHFPELRGLLGDAMAGRSASRLAPFAESAFMAEWDIRVRYAPTSELVGEGGRTRRYERWKADAQNAMNALTEHG